MTVKEVEDIMKDYGFERFSICPGTGECAYTEIDSVTKSMHGLPVVHVDTRLDGSFRISYCTLKGALKLSTDWCSPITMREHFMSHLGHVREFSAVLYRYEQALRREND